MNAPALDELLAHVDALPSLPEIVSHLMHSLGDEDADIDTLARQINADPAIVARLLAAANSSAFGFASRIDSARQAFLVLGVDRVTNIILATALIQRFDAKAQDFDAHLLWRHTLGVATCARALAEQTRINPEVAFTAGLLHDIGQLMMLAAAPAAYAESLQLQKSEGISMLSAEIAIFGYDHAVAGGMLATAWKLPREIGEAIAAHHNPDESRCSGGELCDLIHVAEVLSHALDLGQQPNNLVPELSERACVSLGISWSNFASRFGEIEARYDGMRIALGI